ncbi:MAG: NAD(P)H-binding protein [Longimicrobiales bacterium]
MSNVPRAFVAGATGYAGRGVVEALRARGVATHAHVRPDSSRLVEWRRRFRAVGAEVDTTAWDEAALAARLEELGPTHVFSLLGTTRVRAREAARIGRESSYETVDYGLSTLLIRATRAGAPAARFVYLSALGVGPRARGAYLQARVRVERELRSSGLGYTIVRPAFITGADREERRPLERVAAGFANACSVVAAALGRQELARRVHSVSSAELAPVLVDAALDPQLVGCVLDAGGSRVDTSMRTESP